MIIELEPHLIAKGDEIGRKRQAYAEEQGLRELHGAAFATPEERLALHIQGAQAEIAVAKGLRLTWRPNVGVLNAMDVGGLVEVRSITTRGHSLIVYGKDREAAPFVLVLAEPPTFTLVGWLIGSAAKRDRYWRTEGVRSPAFFVPGNLDHLRPIDQLATAVARFKEWQASKASEASV